MEVLKQEQTIYQLKIFILIVLSTLFLSGFIYTGQIVYEKWYGEPRFSEGTQFGPIAVQGLKKAEAEQKISEEVTSWLGKPTNVFLLWKDQRVALEPMLFQFDIKGSISQVYAGIQPLVVHLDQNQLQTVVKGIVGTEGMEQLDLKGLEKSLIELASGLPAGPAELEISAYFTEPIKHLDVVVSKGQVMWEDHDPLLEEWVSKLNPIVIQPEGTLSILSLLKQEKIAPIRSYALGMLSTGIYETILNTNFEIEERHIGWKMSPYSELGMEAQVIPDKSDLVIRNPNPSPYTFELKYEANELHVVIKGAPLPYTYRVVKRDERTFAPKTILQFNPRLAPGESIVKEIGEPGYLVQVVRQKLNKTIVVEEEIISEDFYPPVHRVEERSSTPDDVIPEDTVNENGWGTPNLDRNSEIMDQPSLPKSSNSSKTGEMIPDHVIGKEI